MTKPAGESLRRTHACTDRQTGNLMPSAVHRMVGRGIKPAE